MPFISYIAGAFLGWGIGANDSGNLFGTAVGSRMVRYRTATILIAICVILGAVLQGQHGIKTVSALSSQTLNSAVICTISAACAVTLMSLLRMPVSTSQALIGAIVGIGMIRDNVQWQILAKVIVCWIAAPVTGIVLSWLLYRLFRVVYNHFRPDIFVLDPLLRSGMIIFGCYAAYALGANASAIVAAVFVGSGEGMVSMRAAALFGGCAIAVGALTYSHRVMMTIGEGVMSIDTFSAFIGVLALALTIHLFAFIGVPVSSSQSMIGCLLGIGLVKGLQVINYKTLRRIAAAWVITPIISAILAMMIYTAAR